MKKSCINILHSSSVDGKMLEHEVEHMTEFSFWVLMLYFILSVFMRSSVFFACVIICVACAALCVAAVPVHDVKRLAWNSSEHASCPELERTHSGPCASAHGVGGITASGFAAQCKCVGCRPGHTQTMSTGNQILHSNRFRY